MNLPEKSSTPTVSWFVSELHAFRPEEAAQHVNFNICLFWIVSCVLPLHVDCFLSIVVGVEDNQTMDAVCHVFHFI